MREQKRTLTAKEQAFVDALITPEWPTIEEAAISVGYEGPYGRQLKIKPHIKQAIAERIAELREDRIHDIERALKKTLQRGLDDERKDARENVELFLEASGMLGRGTKVITTVTQTGTGHMDNLSELLAERMLGGEIGGVDSD